MAFKIVWSPDALTSYLSIITYLEKNWTEREIRNFVRHIEDKIQLLKTFPYIGSPFDKKKQLRKTLVHEKVQLYYRVRLRKKQVELVLFRNIYLNPDSLKKLK